MYILCVCVSRSGDPGLSPFDLETGMPVASKVENLPSQIGHDRPLGSRIICRVRDGRRTDRQTDGRTKATLIAPFPSIRGRRHNNFRGRMATAIQQVQSS